MNHQSRIAAVVPFSLRDAPAFIEQQLPVGRVSAESYKERKGGAGQTLTALGSYWKGRKPLVLVRATILGCLLPATSNALADLRIFLMLMGMDDNALIGRLEKFSPKNVDIKWLRHDDLVTTDDGGRVSWRRELKRPERDELIAEWLATLPYDDRLQYCARSEDVSEQAYLSDAWPEINDHLGTSAGSVAELVDQLGIMRFGHRPQVADTFAGGGSIPFEAARMGCESAGSDLNPIACLLTWGAIDVIGGDDQHRVAIAKAQQQVVASIAGELKTLGVEEDDIGNRAKSYLYCLEARCTKTGYLVPVAPSWVISRNHRVVAKLTPRPASMDYAIDIVSGASDDEIAAAETGTLIDDVLIHPANPNREGVSMSVIRGDYKTNTGENANKLRRWESDEIQPKKDDRFQERLYCIQWLKGRSDDAATTPPAVADEEDDGRSTFYAAPTARDIAAEATIQHIVETNLKDWQNAGWLPSQTIEPGQKTNEPIRTRGWTRWHQLFTPRHLLFGALALKAIQEIEDKSVRGALLIGFCRTLNYMSRMTQWRVRKPSPKKPADQVNHVFYNQALNTFYNFGARASVDLFPALAKRFPTSRINGHGTIENRPAAEVNVSHDIYITDPPYADAVAYHEITEYFIAWAHKLGAAAFPDFDWDSRRSEAIKGSDEKFRSDMVAAYRAMAMHMPDNGIQVVMFTHQDAGVWADLASIMWAAGLKVSAAWNVVTETNSALKQGNYVQGTILLVLRKRTGSGNAKRMDIEGEIEDAVDLQIRAMHDLSHDWTAERLYTDGDMQLAAYASALRIITNYETIDRVQVGADVYRKLKKGERTVIRDLIDYAATVANNKLVPDSFSPNLWRDLDKTSRFYARMLDVESKGSTKFSDYQDFAKTFSVGNYTELMAETKANQAALAGASDLKARGLGGSEFATQPLRHVLFAIFKTMQKGEPKDGVSFLRIEYGTDYWVMRTKLIEFSRYISMKTATTRPEESAAADLLTQKLEVDRL